MEKVDQYTELTVPLMTDRQFEMHFRLESDGFVNLVHIMAHVADLFNIDMSEEIPLEK